MISKVSRTQFLKMLGGAFGFAGASALATKAVANTVPDSGFKWPHLATGISEQRRGWDDHGLNPERVYAQEWEGYCTPTAGGLSPLELILQFGGEDQLEGGLTLRDAEIAARLIQWLGTNCGLGFMSSCEKKIEHARKIRDEAVRLEANIRRK